MERAEAAPSVTVEVADLIGAGHLAAGQSLYSRPGKYGGHSGTILSDGRIEVAGQTFESPSSSATFVRKKNTNGWHFWRMDPNGHRALSDVRSDYLRVVSPEEVEEDDATGTEAE
jgi:hypothetical protein